MREIKFRGWDKELNFMINIKRYKIDFNGQVLFDNNDKELYNQTNKIELMQYTGLKDKNDVEIYEGDIVRVRVILNAVYECTFKDGAFMFIEHSKDSQDKWIGRITDADYEVIGNIYENQELPN